MSNILIIYYSKTGNTKIMAEMIKLGVQRSGGKVTLLDVKKITLNDLIEADGIIVGSPTYYGSIASPIKKLFDDTIAIHGKLVDKVGAAFTSSAFMGGGNELAIMDILHAMMVHGMIIQGNYKGDHFGPVSINKPDERTKKLCLRLSERVINLINRLKST